MHLDLLRAVSILRELDDAELAGFAELLHLRKVKFGERVIEEGEPVTALYIVCDGVFHVRRLAQQREMLMGRLGPGAFFGEINFFDPGVATASVEARQPGDLAVIPYAGLREFLSANPATGYKITSAMMTEMARRLRQIGTRLASSVYWSAGDVRGVPET